MSSGGRCSAPASVARVAATTLVAPLIERIPSASSRAASSLRRAGHLEALCCANCMTSRRSTTRFTTPDLRTSCSPPGVRSSRARISSPASTSTPRSIPSPACCAPTREAGRLDALARTAGLSPSHLSRIFKDQTGVSITRFRNQRRLERFMILYGRRTPHDCARRRARRRVRQLRPVLPRLSPGDGAQPVRVCARAVRPEPLEPPERGVVGSAVTAIQRRARCTQG